VRVSSVLFRYLRPLFDRDTQRCVSDKLSGVGLFDGCQLHVCVCGGGGRCVGGGRVTDLLQFVWPTDGRSLPYCGRPPTATHHTSAQN
jgi:hypothetical protein